MTKSNDTRYWHVVKDEDNAVALVLATPNKISDQAELMGLENFVSFMESEKHYTVELNEDGNDVLVAAGYLDLDEVMSNKTLDAFCRQTDLRLDESEYKEFRLAVMMEQSELVRHSLPVFSPLKLTMTFDHYGYRDKDSRNAGDILHASLKHALYEGSAEMNEVLMTHDTVIRTLLDAPDEHASMVTEHPHLPARIRNGLKFQPTPHAEVAQHRIDCMTSRISEYPIGEAKGRETVKKEIRAIAASLPLSDDRLLSRDTHLSALNTLIDSALYMGMGDAYSGPS